MNTANTITIISVIGLILAILFVALENDRPVYAQDAISGCITIVVSNVPGEICFKVNPSTKEAKSDIYIVNQKVYTSYINPDSTGHRVVLNNALSAFGIVYPHQLVLRDDIYWNEKKYHIAAALDVLVGVNADLSLNYDRVWDKIWVVARW